MKHAAGLLVDRTRYVYMALASNRLRLVWLVSGITLSESRGKIIWFVLDDEQVVDNENEDDEIHVG